MLKRTAQTKRRPNSIEVKVIGGKIYIHAEGSSNDG
jgi:hypothetical protein